MSDVRLWVGWVSCLRVLGGSVPPGGGACACLLRNQAVWDAAGRQTHCARFEEVLAASLLVLQQRAAGWALRRLSAQQQGQQGCSAPSPCERAAQGAHKAIEGLLSAWSKALTNTGAP